MYPFKNEVIHTTYRPQRPTASRSLSRNLNASYTQAGFCSPDRETTTFSRAPSGPRGIIFVPVYFSTHEARVKKLLVARGKVVGITKSGFKKMYLYLIIIIIPITSMGASVSVLSQ